MNLPLSQSCYNKSEPIMVSIVVTAYNHEKYIRQTIENFLNQITNFRVEILINDDCSTDTTASIIKGYELKYPTLFRVFYQKENQYSKGIKPLPNVLFPATKGKYIALCEGDDYWTDPFKLQKQVDFLEVNYNFIACSHQTKILRMENFQFFEDRFDFSESKDLGLNEVVSTLDPFHLSSYMFRCILIPNLILFFKKWKKPFSGDSVIYVLSCKLGLIRFFAEEMSVYRLHKGGITSTITNDIPKYLFNQYITWVLLSKQFNKNERELYFNPLINYYENYLIKKVKKMKLSNLFTQLKFFYISNPIDFSTKFHLTYKLLKNKIFKTI